MTNGDYLRSVLSELSDEYIAEHMFCVLVLGSDFIDCNDNCTLFRANVCRVCTEDAVRINWLKQEHKDGDKLAIQQIGQSKTE